MKQKVDAGQLLDQPIKIRCGSDQPDMTGRITAVYYDAPDAKIEFLDISVDVSLIHKDTIVQWEAIKKASQAEALVIKKKRLSLRVQFCKSSLKMPDFRCRIL